MAESPLKHPFLKSGIGCLIQVATGAVAIPIAIALNGQSTPLAAALIPIHAIQILAFIYSLCIDIAGVRLKVKGSLGGVILTLVVLMLDIFLLLLESYALAF